MDRTIFVEQGNRSLLGTRQGNVLVLVSLCLTLLLGIVACALDVGWMMMARTQLQAGSDASSLAGGTELLPGLGTKAYKTPAQVETAASAQAIAFAARHYAAESPSILVNAARDVRFGKAHMAGGAWQFDWGLTPYNAVQVTTRRSVEGSGAGDGPLPLIIAPAIGHETASVEAVSTAVIMPSKGVYIPPGSEINSALSPFAYLLKDYEKYKRAQAYFTSVLGSNPALITTSILDTAETPPTPLFYTVEVKGGKTTYRQIFKDVFRVSDPERQDSANVLSGPDGTLEISIFPAKTTSAGNFGTVDVGDPNNSTTDLKRQITYGPNAHDLSFFPDNTLDLGTPVSLNGDTGISAGIENSLQGIIGQTRAILLYSDVAGPGNNAEFRIVDLIGVRIMSVDFSGGNKTLIVQPAVLKDPGGLPDYDDDDGSDNSVFSPLILAQ